MYVFCYREEPKPLDRDTNALLEQGKTDNTTVVEVSIKIYFSEAVEKSTTDIVGKVAEIIATTNEIYLNSKILMKLVVPCIEKYTGEEVDDGGKQLKLFKYVIIHKYYYLDYFCQK